MSLRVLFVCTANISRSPYAEIRMGELFRDRVMPASAGVPGTEGRSMDPAMEAELPFEDEHALAHRSRVLTGHILDEHDLVLTMEFAHHMRIFDKWPHHRDRVFGLRQFVDGVRGLRLQGDPRDIIERAVTAVGPNSMMLDIADPYRRGSRAARACAQQLDRLVLDLGVGLGLHPNAEDKTRE